MGKILVIDDEAFITKSLGQHLVKEGYDVYTAESGEEGIDVFKTDIPDVVLLDLNMPGIGGIETLTTLRKIQSDIVIIIITAHGDIETAVSAIKSGAYDFVEKPFELDRISVLVSKAMETVNLKREVNYFREEKFDTYSFPNIVGESAAMKDVSTLAKKVADSDANTILILGESGTGKSLLARTIHYNSPRASQPFVEVTCTAIPETLIESELFGHEKGAFTDAKVAKKGLFEIASGGTIYLDEIGDIKLSTQAKLLRALEEKTFKRVGGLKDIKVNVRIIATTNKHDLEGAVREGKFRADLYYRLKVLPINILPLRERKKDIIPLALHHINKFNKEFRKNITGISSEVEKLLLHYPWHGNARELRNIIERIFILENTDLIRLEHVPPELIEYSQTTAPDTAPYDFSNEGLTLKDVEKDLIAQALEKVDGNQTKAAKLLGISRDALRYKMHKFEILK